VLSFNVLLLPLVLLWSLGIAVLLLHRLSPRLGFAPLLVFLGGLGAAFAAGAPGALQLELGGRSLALGYGPLLLLPAALLGLLLVRLGGALRARDALAGLLLLALFLGLLNLLSQEPSLRLQSAWRGLAAALALGAGAAVLFGLCRGERPGAPRAGLALVAAGAAGGALYTIDTLSWEGDIGLTLLAGLAGPALASLALWPLLAYYLRRVFPALPDGGSPHPARSLATSEQQLEARASDHYNYFRILAQANRLIAGAEDSQALLDEICRLLAARLDYPLVWVGLLGGDPPGPTAQAGPQSGYLRALAQQSEDSIWADGAVSSALQCGEGAARLDIARSIGTSAWKELALQFGLRSSAAFPLRHGGHSLGVLAVYGSRPFAFSQAELDLLQELADGMAHALINLGTRRQQVVLYSAAETMQDGLIISDMNGTIIYTNPAVSALFQNYTDEMTGKNIKDILPDPQEREVIALQLERLVQEGQAEFDFEHHTHNGRVNHFSVRAAQVHGAPGKVDYAVVNLHNTTRRRQYERLLLTLHQYTNDIVQARRIEGLLEEIFQAGEELMQAGASEVCLLDGDGGSGFRSYRHGLPENRPSRGAAPFAGPLVEQALRSGLPLAVEDIQESTPDGAPLPRLQEAGLRALLVLPVLFQGRPIGAFVLYYQQPHSFQEDEIQLGVTLVQTLAIAIQNARLFQEEHRQRQLAESLVQAAMALNNSLDLDQVLEEILTQVLTVIPCRSVSLMLVEGEEARRVRCVDCTQVGVDSGAEPVCLPLTAATLQAMLESRKPLLIPDTSQYPAWAEIDSSSWIRSYTGTPLIAGEQVIGFLNLNSDIPNFFTEEIARLLQAFGSYAATAIQNASLYRRLQSYAAELEQRVGERTAELTAAKERIERILVSVPDAIFVLDDDRRLVQENPAGETLRLLAAGCEQDLFSQELFSHLDPGGAPHEKAVVEVGGRAYQALASSLPIQGRGLGSVVVFRDVTRFRELDQIKTKFVSDVSHELRTPLTNLSLYIDLVSTARSPEGSAKYLATLRRETERLTDLIEGLLTISRLEAGRIWACFQRVDLDQLVSNLVIDRHQMASGRELTLSYDRAPALPAVQTDPHLLTQVLSNLLTNAFNYTPTGGRIQVITAFHPPSEPGGSGRPALPDLDPECGWVSIQVRDTGAGIRPEELPQLFTRFYRGSASRATNAPGTGLGLAISKEIMDRLGGRISVESTPGEGSAFTVWLRAGDML